MFQLRDNSLIDINTDQQVATITLDSPPANVISSSMVKELQQACLELARTMTAVIITGRGNHSFSTGASIKEQGHNSPADNQNYFLELYHMLETIADLPCPIIAAINGYALGAGFELALCSDIRIMDETAVMGAVGVNLGLVFSTQRLPRLIGAGKAKEMLFTGRRLDAREALALGIVEYVTPAGLALTKAQEIAKVIASKNTHNLHSIKKAVNQGLNMDLAQALELESRYLIEMLDTENYRLRVKRFLHEE
ncbi:enoyl-coa hydratase [hydrocarbon metagenome]|uniref:Enoyl-coa hydratase n=1 Tax=hydrocarbon metagenome TaxID=938273 RepID=A0A0W8E3R7_9ZZZZ